MTWEELEQSCKTCTKCELCRTRTNTVFGVGNRKTGILFVGEAPGEQEDLKGEPFVGAAGKLFDRFLEAVDIPREDIYIANILKCRPPKNRDPLPAEEDACIGYLQAQIDLIRPPLVVCLGRIAAMRLIKPDFRITKEHGIWVKKDNYEICAVYHPSLLLRDPRRKPEMMEDMKLIAQRYAVLKGLGY